MPVSTDILNWPMLPKPEPPAQWDVPLRIRYVKTVDLWSLFFDLACLALLWGSISVLAVMACRYKGISSNRFVTVTLPTACVITVVALFHDKFWTTAAGRKGRAYFDYLLKRMVIYTDGINITSITSRVQADNIDFQKKEIVEIYLGSDDDQDALQTADALNVIVKARVFYQRLNRKQYFARSLKYTDEEIKALIRSKVASYIAAIVGCNRYDVLLANKEKVAAFIAGIFDGESVLSFFELSIGYAIFNPILDSIGVDEDSLDTRQAIAKLDVIQRHTKELVDNCKVKPEEALRAVQVELQSIDQTVTTVEYKGVPPGVRIFAPGNTGVAIGTKSSS